MINSELVSVILSANRERRTGNMITTACATRQTSGKGSFASPEVAVEFKNLPTPEPTSYGFADLLGIV